MRVRITGKVTYETELSPEDYANVKGVTIKTDDDILAFERRQDSGGLVEAMLYVGELSDVKIEKIDDATKAAA